MDRSFGNAFVLVILFELFLTAVLLLFADPILQVFGVTETAYEYAVTYYRIVALGCLFQGLTQVFCDFVRVSGKPVMGMCVTGVGAVSNIVLDALFVAVLDWGVAGAAWATVIGQILSTLFGAYQVFKGKTMVRIHKSTFSFDWSLTKKIISCGFAFWVSQMAMGFISLVYNSQLGKYGGDIAISVYAVVASIMTFVIMPASGISQGIQPILGNNFGAGNYKRIMNTLYLSSVFSVAVTCVIWLIVMIFPKQILMAFGGTDEMLASACAVCASISALLHPWLCHADHHVFPVHRQAYPLHHHHPAAPGGLSRSVYLSLSTISGCGRHLLRPAHQRYTGTGAVHRAGGKRA